MKSRTLAFALVLAVGLSAPAETLKINGSTTVNPPVAEAAEILRAERQLEIQVDTQGGSSGGISMLGDGTVQIGMSSKPLSDDDRARYPGVDFRETQIGEDAVAMVVSRDVWEGGVRVLSRTQLRGIYEGRITNWRDAGGAAQRIVFFNKEPGRGTWEVFVQWLYGSAKAAPQVSFPEVGGNEEARSKVGSTRGAISQLSATWADGVRVWALGIRLEDGSMVEPTSENIATQRYPLSRPLYLLTRGAPVGAAATLVDFMVSERGQELVKKHGYLGMKDLRK